MAFLFRIVVRVQSNLLLFVAFLLVADCILMGIAAAPHALSQDVTDAEVKAALTFKFPVYVRWPEEAVDDLGNLFKCCVYGDGRLSDLLKSFHGETLMGKTVQVRQVSDLDGLGACRMLFVGASAAQELSAILDAVENKPILTIGDVKGFARKGGIVNFIRKNDSVGFEINPEAGKRAGLKISSKLLRLATIVED